MSCDWVVGVLASPVRQWFKGLRGDTGLLNPGPGSAGLDSRAETMCQEVGSGEGFRGKVGQEEVWEHKECSLFLCSVVSSPLAHSGLWLF